MLVELDVPKHPRQRVMRIRHSRFFVLVGVEHLRHEVQRQETADFLHNQSRLAHQILEHHPALAFGRDALQEPLDVLMAQSPNQFGQLRAVQEWAPVRKTGKKRCSLASSNELIIAFGLRTR